MKETKVVNTINYTIENDDGFTLYFTENRVHAYEKLEWYRTRTQVPVTLKKVTTNVITEIVEFPKKENIYELTLEKLLKTLADNGIDVNKLNIVEDDDEE